jgi:hypothetical protein
MRVRGLTNVPILDIPPRFALALDDIIGLLDKVLQEHFRGDGDHEGCVVRAV